MKEISRRKLLGTSLAGLASLPLLETLKTPDPNSSGTLLEPTEVPTQCKPEIDYETLKSIDRLYFDLPVQSVETGYYFSRWIALYGLYNSNQVTGFRINCPWFSMECGFPDPPKPVFGSLPIRSREVSPHQERIQRESDYKSGCLEPLHTCEYAVDPVIFNYAIKQFETWLASSTATGSVQDWYFTDRSWVTWSEHG